MLSQKSKVRNDVWNNMPGMAPPLTLLRGTMLKAAILRVAGCRKLLPIPPRPWALHLLCRSKCGGSGGPRRAMGNRPISLIRSCYGGQAWAGLIGVFSGRWRRRQEPWVGMEREKEKEQERRKQKRREETDALIQGGLD